MEGVVCPQPIQQRQEIQQRAIGRTNGFMRARLIAPFARINQPDQQDRRAGFRRRAPVSVWLGVGGRAVWCAHLAGVAAGGACLMSLLAHRLLSLAQGSDTFTPKSYRFRDANFANWHELPPLVHSRQFAEFASFVSVCLHGMASSTRTQSSCSPWDGATNAWVPLLGY